MRLRGNRLGAASGSVRVTRMAHRREAWGAGVWLALAVFLALTCGDRVGRAYAQSPLPEASPPAASPTVSRARMLLDEANRLEDTTRAWKDRTQRLKLRIVDGRGSERNRELVMKTLKRPGGEDKSIVVFHSPPEVRGTSFLQFAHRDRDAEQWLYLPALGRVRQISAQSKNESFMGTDFSYRDLELLTDVLEWTEEEAPATVVGSETVDGLQATLIELEPRAKDVGYQRIRLLMSEPDLLIHRMEFYASRGATPKKTLKLTSYRDIQGIPTSHALEMAQPGAGSTTYVEVSDVRYDSGLGEDDFTTRALERGDMDAD